MSLAVPQPTEVAMRKNLLFFGLLLMCLVPVRKTHAQSYACGMRCESTCEINGEDGRGAVDGTWNPLAMHYEMGCKIGGDCGVCGATRRGGDNDGLAASLASAPTEAVAKIASANRRRILVSLARNLIVIRGSDCNPDAFVAVAAVSKARARQLAQLGITELETATPPATTKRAN
jgi:hypothetical protein